MRGSKRMPNRMSNRISNRVSNIYMRKSRETLVENDEISAEEAAFMEGYTSA